MANENNARNGTKEVRVIDEKKKYKLKKTVKELEKIRGRHTELVSVYIPAGYSIVDVINQLKDEQGTASNIKSKSTRKNVLTALEKIIQHLRIFKSTPPNGLVVFSGNVSEVEGKEDIRLWSFEPPELLKTKIYWCDQTFVLDPLREMMKERDVYGLIVLDAREATVGLLSGKSVRELKHLDSTVPSKTVKGGMCVGEDTLIEMENGGIIPIKELTHGNKILSYSFSDFNHVFVDSFEIFKKKSKNSMEVFFKEPSTSIVFTPEHLVFVVGNDGIEEKSVSELKIGDRLLFIARANPKCEENTTISGELSQLLGYILGDGTIDGNRIILYDKDIQVIREYKKIAENLLKKKVVILKKGNTFELRLYSKKFTDFITMNFPKISTPRRKKDIDGRIMTLPKEKLKYFLRGLFDAEAYIDKLSGIGIRMTNEKIMRKVQLALTRFEIVSSLRGPDNFERYELRITNPIYIKNFQGRIGFSCEKKALKLNLKIKKYKSGMSTRVPISGKFVRKLIEKAGLKKEDFKKYSMYLAGMRSLGYPPFEELMHEIKKKIKDRYILDLLEKIKNSGLVTTTVKEIRHTKADKEFYDLHVPRVNSFVANGVVVHNSQGRYDRLREDAINEFLTKVGDTASELLLKHELKGIIIGGPGPVKERFAKGTYLNYMLLKKLLGVKDTGYTSEFGMNELVERSEDLLKESSIAHEKEILDKFFTELEKEGNVTYGIEEVKHALEAGAVDTLLISEDIDWVRVNFECQCGFETKVDIPRSRLKEGPGIRCKKCQNWMKPDKDELIELTDALMEQAERTGAKVEMISTETREGQQFKELGGIGAMLRFKLG